MCIKSISRHVAFLVTVCWRLSSRLELTERNKIFLKLCGSKHDLDHKALCVEQHKSWTVSCSLPTMFQNTFSCDFWNPDKQLMYIPLMWNKLEHSSQCCFEDYFLFVLVIFSVKAQNTLLLQKLLKTYSYVLEPYMNAVFPIYIGLVLLSS